MNSKIGTIVLEFGPQPIKKFEMYGKDAVFDTDVARMAGATFAIGPADLLAGLRARLEPGALVNQQKETPNLSDAAITWLACGRRGISSNTMFTVMTGVDALGGWEKSHPYDLYDFDRCVALLDAVPALRPRLPLMAGVSRAWAALVHQWDEIERSFIDEAGIGWAKSEDAPRTYLLFKNVLAGAK